MAFGLCWGTAQSSLRSRPPQPLPPAGGGQFWDGLRVSFSLSPEGERGFHLMFVAAQLLVMPAEAGISMDRHGLASRDPSVRWDDGMLAPPP